MSGLDSLLDRLRRAYAAISEMEETAARFPGDRFVLANIGALKSDAEEMERLWEEECQRARVEVCRYRLLPQQQDRYSLSDVSKSLLDFQELFSQIYSALKTGVRRRARVSSEILAETSFEFGFSYPGSLGVAMMVGSSASLFGSKYEEAVDAFMQVMTIQDESDVRDLSKALGDAVVKKAYDWSRVNYGAGYGVDVTWKGVEGKIKGGMIDTISFERIVDIVQRTSDIERSSVDLRGTLDGIDTKTKRFRFTSASGDDFSGFLDPDFDIGRKWSVNTGYIAHIDVESVTEYATQETKKTYRLVSLGSMQ